jgi:hypothetical protein
MRILIAFVVFLSVPAYAKNFVAYLGGGGEPDGPKTIFDSGIPAFGKYVSSAEVELSLSFNGGHARTESKIASSFPGKTNTPFTGDAFKALIDRYENDIRSGKITPSDQLMLYIDTHGAEAMDGQKTHNIATSGAAISNFDRFDGPTTVSLDRLQTLSALAEQKGIKLAIIDVSCHSGASLPLANSKTCVIAATGPNLYGYAGYSTFSSDFVKNMRPGRNLEELFYDVRDNSSDTDFPMISSGAGKEVQDEIYPLLKRFLFDYEKNSPSKLQSDIINSLTTNSCSQEDQSLAELSSLLSAVEDVSHRNFKKLREAVSEYQALRHEIQDRLRGMVLNPALSESRQFCSNGACISYTGKEVLAMDIEATIKLAREKASRTPSSAAFYQSWENALVQARSWKNELLSNPQVAGFPDFFKNYPNLEKRTEKLASRVSHEERKLYKEMVEEKGRTTQGPNPCRDFRI